MHNLSQYQQDNIPNPLKQNQQQRQVLGQIDFNREHERNQSGEARSSKPWKQHTLTAGGARNAISPPSSSHQQQQQSVNSENDQETTDDCSSTFYVAPYDEPHIDDPQECVEYIVEITEHLKTIEEKSLPDPQYMENQAEITSNMRSILNDWILDVHFKFRLNQETLYLTVNLIDRFLSKLQCARSQLQLLGVTALMIACKYEEIFHPKTSKLLDICANVYSKDNLLNMEICLLNALEYQVTAATPYFFLKRYLLICHADSRAKMSAFYLSELALLSYPMIKYKSSHLAAACVWLAMKLVAPEKLWDQCWARDVGFSSQELAPCLRELANLGILQKDFLSNKLNACSKKYARQRRMSVSQDVPARLAELIL